MGYGIQISGETAAPGSNVHDDVRVLGNLVEGPDQGPSVGISVEDYSSDNLFIVGNTIRAAYPINLGGGSGCNESAAPGIGNTEIAGNMVRPAGNNNGFIVADNHADCVLRSGVYLSVHDNMVVDTASGTTDGTKVFHFTNSAWLASARVKVYNNTFKDNPVDGGMLGTETKVTSGFSTIMNGTSASANVAVAGTLVGDVVRRIRLLGSSSVIPAGITITAQTIAANTVQVVITNNSGSSFTPKGDNTPVIWLERK